MRLRSDYGHAAKNAAYKRRVNVEIAVPFDRGVRKKEITFKKGERKEKNPLPERDDYSSSFFFSLLTFTCQRRSRCRVCFSRRHTVARIFARTTGALGRTLKVTGAQEALPNGYYQTA